MLLTSSWSESSPSCGSDETGGGVGSGEDKGSLTSSGVEALTVGWKMWAPAGVDSMIRATLLKCVHPLFLNGFALGCFLT